MEIGDRIHKKQFDFITTYGLTPKKIYLGHDEMEEFLTWIQNFMEHKEKQRSRKGMEFLGLKIFEVSEQNHFTVTL